MYTTLEYDVVNITSLIKPSTVNIHIMISPTIFISKVDLYRYLRSLIETTNLIQLYLYTTPDKPWIEELDKLMISVFKPYHNINIVILTNTSSFIEASKHIDSISNPLISKDFTLTSIPSGVSLIKTVIKLISKYIKDVLPYLKLKILYVEQADRELSDVEVDYYRIRNSKILSSFNLLIDTSIDFYSIFTSSTTIDSLISSNRKGVSRDIILIVIDSVDRSSSVNRNNNSHYIPIDTYITPRIIGKIFDIVLTNISK